MKINFERIKYSPFGQKWHRKFKLNITVSAICAAFMVFFSLLIFLVSPTAGIISLLLLPALFYLSMYLTSSDYISQAKQLSAMSEHEFEELVREYRQFEEKNIVRYGHLTSYGIILDDGMLPWNSITEIEFKPKEYSYTHNGTDVTPARIIVTGKTGKTDKKSRVLTQYLGGETYNLSDEIDRFIDSIPKYTEHRLFINNNYYYEG